MDVSLQSRAEQLANEFAGQATTVEELNQLMRLMMKCGVRRATPRAGAATCEPQLVGKHQRRVPGFDEKILALYAKGMTTRDIQEIVRELYGVDVSAPLVSEITADLDAEVTAWQTRPIEAVWPIVYFDGIVVHVRGGNGRVSQHTIYVALGVNLAGKKELLGLGLGEG